MSFLGKLFSKENKKSLDKGLKKSKDGFFSRLNKTLIGKSVVDDEVLDQIEEALIESDVGVGTTIKIIERLEKRVAKDKYLNTEELDVILREEIAELIAKPSQVSDLETHQDKPFVILVVGVNGVGKTTTIGKLAAKYCKQNKKVILGAADTFRAAAVEQLKLHGQRVGVPVISKTTNADPSSVAFETVKEGLKQEVDVIIIDTAGRLHTKVNLMAELSKIERVIQKVIPNAPHEVMLVLDGSTGQNAIIQAREFTKATNITTITVTKLDGTAKGGVVIGIADEFKIPVKYIGVGEKIDDLLEFDKVEFVDSLFRKD